MISDQPAGVRSCCARRCRGRHAGPFGHCAVHAENGPVDAGPPRDHVSKHRGSRTRPASPITASNGVPGRIPWTRPRPRFSEGRGSTTIVRSDGGPAGGHGSSAWLTAALDRALPGITVPSALNDRLLTRKRSRAAIGQLQAQFQHGARSSRMLLPPQELWTCVSPNGNCSEPVRRCCIEYIRMTPKTQVSNNALT